MQRAQADHPKAALHHRRVACYARAANKGCRACAERLTRVSQGEGETLSECARALARPHSLAWSRSEALCSRSSARLLRLGEEEKRASVCASRPDRQRESARGRDSERNRKTESERGERAAGQANFGEL